MVCEHTWAKKKRKASSRRPDTMMVTSSWSRNRCQPLKNLSILKALANIWIRDSKVKQSWPVRRTKGMTKTMWRQVCSVTLLCRAWRAYPNVAMQVKYMKTKWSLGAAFQFILVKRSTKVWTNWMPLQVWRYGASRVLSLMVVRPSPVQLHIKTTPEALSSWTVRCWVCLLITSESRSLQLCLTISGKPPLSRIRKMKLPVTTWQLCR